MPTTNLRASAHAILAAGIVIGAALGIPAGAIISSAPAIAAPKTESARPTPRHGRTSSSPWMATTTQELRPNATA